MADLGGMRLLLDYRALGAAYEEYGRNGAPNPFYDYYVGNAVGDASAEVTAIVDDGGDGYRDVPVVSAAGAGTVERFDTDTVEYLFLSRVKDPAPINKKGAPARVVQPTGGATNRITLFNMFNKLDLGMDALQGMREPENWVLQRKGSTEVMKQVADFATKHRMTKEVIHAKAFTDGVIYANSSGQILESSTGAEMTVDLGVAASHKTNLDNGTAAIISALWSNTGTDIFAQLDTLMDRAESENVEQPIHIWMNGVNRYMLRNNTKIASYFSGVSNLAQALAGNEFQVPGSPFVFHFFSGSYKAVDGSTKPFIPTTKAVITPDLGKWFLNAQGMQYVPTSIDIAQSTDEALASLQEVFGDFAYAKMNHNPVCLEMYLGCNFMYAFRNPSSIWIPTIA